MKSNLEILAAAQSNLIVPDHRIHLRLKALVFVSIVSALLLALPFSAPQSLAQNRGPASVADIAEELKGAVVNISTTQKLKESSEVPIPELPEGSPFEEYFEDFFNNQESGQGNQRSNSLGSGFVVDPAGYVVTNNHVIEGADEITVIFTDGSKLKVVEVVGRDAKTDLAVLKVEPKKPLTFVKFGDSEKMRVGDWVMAIGNPFGLGGTVTVGVISATRRDINSGNYDEFLQTDAAINRGNSGGPLFNMDGQVVGVNTAIISPTGGSIGIGFAVPSNSASHVINQLKEYGETRRGWLGVHIQSVSEEIAESLGLTIAQGALVAGVTEDGPAAKAGIIVGDVILKFDGLDVTAMRQLPKLVAQTAIDKEVELEILRKGERKIVRAKIGRLEEETPKAGEDGGNTPPEKKSELNEQPNSQHASLGLTLAEIDSDLRSRYNIEPGVDGLVVTEIDPESDAADQEVKIGDVVVEVTHEKVKSISDLDRRIETLRRLKRKTALLLLSSSEGEMNFIALAIER